MYWNRSAAAVAAAWQTEAETKLEAGAVPLLVGGEPSLVFDGTVTLLAEQVWSAARTDPTVPLLVAGGTGALWLGLMLSPLAQGGASEPEIVYAGASPATYLAAVAVMSTGTATPPGAVATGTPLDVALWLSPRLHPGAPAPWEALPFVEVGEHPHPPLADIRPAVDSTSDWIAWGAMLLALFLVLLALLI